MLKVVNPFHFRKYYALVACAAPYGVVFACNEFVFKKYRHMRRRRREKEMCVASVDSELVQSVVFALRSACRVAEGLNGPGQDRSATMTEDSIEDIAFVFCATKDIAQCVFELLMSSMRELETHLEFWTRQQKLLSDGRQRTLFLLLRRGPISFIRDLLSLAGIHRNRELSNSADVISKRVLTLHIVRRGIAEAIAATHRAACRLHRVRGTDGSESTGGAIRLDQNQLADIAENRELLARLPFTALDAAFDALLDMRAILDAVLDLSQCCDALGNTPAALVEVDPDLVQLSTVACITSRGLAQDDGRLSATSPNLIHPRPEDDDDAQQRKQHASLYSLSGLAQCQSKSEEAKMLVEAIHLTLSANRRYVWGGSHDGMEVMLEVPKWARKLTPQEEWWILNTVQALMVWKATRFVVVHSPLSGSSDFEDWAVAGVDTVKKSLGEHVIVPFQSLRQKLFMRSESKMGDVTPEKVQLELDTLENMIKHFIEKNQRGVDADGRAGMRPVMETYEKDIQKPVRGILSGRLLNEMLIQVQQMKAESSLLLCEIDKILSTNELTIAMMAAIPAILLMVSVLRFAWRAITPSPPDKGAETMETRTTIIRLKIHLIAATHAEGNSLDGDESGSVACRDIGMAIYGISEVDRAVSRVYRHHAGYGDLVNKSAGNELASLRSAMRALYGPISNSERLALVETIMSSFIVFR